MEFFRDFLVFNFSHGRKVVKLIVLCLMASRMPLNGQVISSWPTLSDSFSFHWGLPGFPEPDPEEYDFRRPDESEFDFRSFLKSLGEGEAIPELPPDRKWMITYSLPSYTGARRPRRMVGESLLYLPERDTISVNWGGFPFFFIRYPSGVHGFAQYSAQHGSIGPSIIFLHPAQPEEQVDSWLGELSEMDRRLLSSPEDTVLLTERKALEELSLWYLKARWYALERELRGYCYVGLVPGEKSPRLTPFRPGRKISTAEYGAFRPARQHFHLAMVVEYVVSRDASGNVLDTQTRIRCPEPPSETLGSWWRKEFGTIGQEQSGLWGNGNLCVESRDEWREHGLFLSKATRYFLRLDSKDGDKLREKAARKRRKDKSWEE